MKRFLIFIVVIVSCQLYAATPNTSSGANIAAGAVNITREQRTDEWITINTIDISMQEQHNGCGFLCASPHDVSVKYQGFPFARGTWSNNGTNERTISTPDGNVSVRFVYKDVKIKLTMVNRDNNREFIKEFSDSASESEREVTPANKCGNLYGCTYSSSVGLISGTITVQVKLPPALSKKTYDLGTISIGQLTVLASSSREYLDFRKVEKSSNLTLSGTIGVPDRCYITIDDGHENPATQLIEFKEIDASSLTAGKELQSKTIKLRSYCVGVQAEKNVYSEVKLGPAGDSIFQDNYILKLKPQKNVESGSDRYLGIVVKALSSTGGQGCTQDSNVFTNDTYKYMGVVVIAGPGGSISGLSSSYPLVFSLCSYGSSGNVLTPGDHTGAVTLTTRWRFDS
ncbi:TPA: hypothetical protein IFJ00_003958 [Escherichia coli]|nr:hypothetical protein [Escherichia coli]